MSSNFFLKQVAFSNDVNKVKAEGNALFFNFNQSASNIINTVDVEDKVKGKGAIGVADFDSTALKDPTFSQLFTDAQGFGDETFEGKVAIDTEVVANFEVAANQTFSFNFSARSLLEATEVENPDAQYNRADLKVGFLVLDVSGNRPRLLDTFGFRGKLITSKQVGKLNIRSSRNVNLDVKDKVTDVDGNNGIDSLDGFASGNYERKFKKDTKISIVKFNESTIKFAGDSLIGNLEDGVIYGTIRRDKLKGSNADEKFYTSLGNDKVEAGKGNDIIEGGLGNDKLDGGKGDDSIYGGMDNDRLIGGDGNDVLVGGDGNDLIKGGRGSDTMTGGAGNDTFVFRKSWLKGEKDVITDFESGIDTIQFKGLGSFSQISDTNDGVLITFDFGRKDGQLLLEGVGVNDLSSRDFVFG
ncbi:MAG: hypothetical protein QNJ51_19010 [Calothrix sp. MO_167.B12]|nr:hypothetical protein [Calothrix sp. MO_167.B12]